MTFDPAEISRRIRMKKKQAREAAPELVTTDSKPDLNPTEAMDMDTTGRIEETLDSPEKINADDTNMDMPMDEQMTIGFTAEELTRMKRLREYLNTLDLSA